MKKTLFSFFFALILFCSAPCVHASGFTIEPARANSGNGHAASPTVSPALDLVPDDVEFQVLKNFYDSLGGPNWTNKTNWPTPGNWPATATVAQMATWYGIAVQNGDIASILFPDINNMTGVIPNSIGMLKGLRTLRLQNNAAITGSIPQSITGLTNLEQLIFLNTGLSGAIPAEITQLSKLWLIDLNGNKFTGTIPDLSVLPLLYLRICNTSTLDPGPIPSWISSLNNLIELNLASTNRTGTIPTALGSLANLKVLALNDNQLTGSIPAELGSCSSLTHLQLFSNQLSGSIPSSLGNLTQLTLLYLRANQLTGNLPPELGNLANLTYLNLGSNQLTGPIPVSFGNLTKLQSLLLNNNLLTGTIPAVLGNLTSLVNLYLYSNQLTGGLPPELGGLSNLQKLYVYINQLSGELPASLGSLTQLIGFRAQTNQFTGTIPSSFSNLTKLTNLNVSANQLSGSLPDIFGSLTMLSEWNISGNAFTGAFPASISSCMQLTDISALDNNFTSLPASLLSLPAVTRFNFNGNDLVSIPNFSNQVNKANLSLYVQSNRLDFSQLEPLINNGIMLVGSPLTQDPISDITAVALNTNNVLTINARPKGQFSTVIWERQLANGSWENVTSLNEDATGQTFRLTSGLPQVGKNYRWKMTNTLVTGVTLTSAPILVKVTEGLVPDDIEFAALKALYDSLGGPNWTTKTNWPTPGNWPATATVAQMGTWYGVKALNGDVSEIAYTGNNISGRIPQSISNLKALKVIQFYSSGLTGPIPASINQLISLRYLNLGIQPALTGSIPDLSALTMLEVFSLPGCTNLTPGPIPEWLTTFPLLTYVNLASTKRTGSIPVGLGNLSNLKEFYLNTNQLSGSIPPSFGGLSNVVILNLGSNQLSGSIPQELCSLPNLVSLYLNNNQLSGNIPAGIENFAKLRYLHFNYNQLTGSIPAAIGNIATLAELGLYGNQLSGSIPETLGNLTNLTSLNLGNNIQLSGPIPSSLGNLANLISLHLNNNALSGAIPAELGNLGNLTAFNLGSNQLTGSIPVSLGNLTKLQGLLLNNNALTGEIPSTLGNLTSLTQLYLYSNQLSGSLPAELGGLSNLQRLYVYHNQLSGSLPPALGNLVKLQDLRAYANQLTGGIPSTFASLAELSTFNVSINQLSGTLPDIFSSLTKLSVLTLSTNAFAGAFPASISSCTLLTDISALDNNFTSLPASLLSLPAVTRFNFNGNDLVSIPNFSNQVNKANLSLYVQNNRLDFSQLEPLINNGIMLVSSPLTQDPISDITSVALSASNVLTIPSRPKGQFSTVVWERQLTNGSWENVTSLNEDATGQTFKLTSGLPQVGKNYRWKMTNTLVTGVTLTSAPILVRVTEGLVPDNLEFGALKALYDSLDGPNWISKGNWPTPGNWPAAATAAQMDLWFGIVVSNGDISEIIMPNNNLTGIMPAAVGNLTALTRLLFHDNKITGRIPAAIANLQALKFLYLQTNQLSGEIPAVLSTMTSLETLALGVNKFTGEIPDLGSLANLKSLILPVNNFTEGPIPPWIGNLSNLQVLDLERTFRNGPIPETFANLTALRQLSLQTNKISCSIPSYFGNLGQLTQLLLHNNQLTGTIPSSIGNLGNLTTLNLQNNQLSGSIPESLGNLSNLFYLYLTTNQLTGSIPSSLGNLSKVIWLLLGDNDLTGNIPAELGNLTDLNLLHLHGNALSGSIPASLGNLTKLTHLFMHSNQLTGGIPAALGNLVNMLEFNVYENQLSGDLPPVLGNLTKLKQFRAYTNQLTGTIPVSFSNLTELTVFNVSANQLSGTLPDIFSSFSKLSVLILSTNGFTGTFPASIGNCNQITDISALDNNFTGLPASLLSLPAVTRLYFNGNDLVSIPDFSSQVNKTNLSLFLQNNRLDFSQLEPLVNAGIKFVTTPLVQDNISDFSSVPLNSSNALIIHARPKGQFSTVVWERQLANGTWENVTSLNEDATGQTFKLTNGLPQVGKTYRWKMTNTKVTGVTLSSDPILVRVTEGLVPDNIEFAALKALYDSLGGPNWTNKTNWPTPGNWPASATAAQMDTWFGIAVSNGDVLEITMPTNNLTGTLPGAVGDLHRLTRLLLHDNKIAGRIPATIANLQNLRYLYFQTNQFTGEIPQVLSTISSLEFLSLGRNKFTGDMPDLGAMTNLKLLFLNDNTFNEGPVPGWLSGLTLLGQIDLSSTKRTGPIPSFIANFQNLTSLSLNTNKLSGEIPSWIGQLPLLSSLYLQSNELTGSIPASLGDLTQLTHLYLASNKLTGSIPQELGSLSNLVYLTLGTNQLTGAIPGSIGNLTKLQGLYLNNNFLTGSIPASFGSLANLAYLYVHKNQLSGSLPAELGNLNKIIELYIHQNSFSGELPLTFGNLSALKYFQAQSNQFTGTIPSSFSNLTALVQLHLSNNQFSGVVPEIFGSMTNLTDLNLSTNDFTGGFPASIGNSILLTYFRGDLNKFTSLPASLLTLPALTSINFEGSELNSIPDLSTQVNKANLSVLIRNNQLDFSHLEPLINAGIALVTYIPQKTINDFSTVPLNSSYALIINARPKGQFSTVFWERQLANGTWENVMSLNEDPTGQTFKLTNGLPQVGKTYRWKMTNTKVTGLTLTSSPILVTVGEGVVPDNIEFQALKDLYDSLNGPNWTIKTNWPAAGNWPATATATEMGTWYGVKVVNGDISELLYSGNNIAGRLPLSVGNLKSLKALRFDASNLTGPIPSSLNQLVSLKHLAFGWQPLMTGAIPDLSALTQLEVFSLRAGSGFTPGPVPEWLATFPLLKRIDLAATQRTGTIPSGIFNLTNLTELDLSANQLTGTIPATIGNLSNLMILNFGNNQLSGSIPVELCSLTKLVTLYLNNNQLSGAIPADIGNLTKLQSLAMGYNQLTGTIPNSICNITTLRLLSIGSNQLSGNIPENIGNMTSLTQIYLDVNQLTGTVPASMGNLTNVGYLYLASNQLSGPLPASLGALNPLYFNISNNQFTGEIPASFSNFSNVILFWIGNNAFSGTLPPNLFTGWTKITSLSVNNNNFSGPFPFIGSSAALVNLWAYANKLTSMPVSILNLPAAASINFEHNELTSIPDFANHVNKANLRLSLLQNRLDLGSLEPLFSSPGISPLLGLTYATQKPFNEITDLVIPRNHPLNIQARNPGPHGSITWEYRANASAPWTNINAQNEDATQRTLRISGFTSSRNGQYRYFMTNTWMPGTTLRSVEINISAGDYPVEWAKLKNVTVTGGALSKTAPGGWNRAGADASNILPPLTNGWIEFVTTSTTGNYIIGLATSDKLDQGSALHGININNSDVLTGETDAFIAAGTQQPGDIFRIAREGSQVRYFRNGTQIRAITADPKLALKVKAVIHSGESPKVLASFDVKPILEPLFTPVSPIVAGGISVITVHGKEPYSYTWSEGTSGAAISGKPVGIYTATSRDAVGRIVSAPYDLGYAVSWTDRMNVNVVNGRLVKTAPQGWGNAGANSVNILKGQEDGWLSFVADTTSGAYIIGFATDDNNFDDQHVAQGLYIDDNNFLYLVEAGAAPARVGSKTAGDVFRILRAGNAVTYFRNGEVLGTVTADPLLSLKIKSVLSTGTAPSVFASFELKPALQAVITPVAANGTGGNITITASGGDAPYTYQWSTGASGTTLSNQPAGTYTVTVTDASGRAVMVPYDIGYQVRWSALKNATEANGSLTKTVAAGWNNGGAVSASYLKGNESGWISFTAGTTPGAYIIGFASEDHQFNEQKVLHGIYITSDNRLYITESGTSTLVGTKVSGDVFRIARAGNQVTYYRNGTVLKTSETMPVLALRVKSSLYTGSSPRVLASFDVEPWLAASVTPISTAGTGGAIIVTASQGDSPYTYRWSQGTAGATLTGQLMGTYIMTATDASGRVDSRTYDLGYRTTWKDHRNVNEAGGALVKTVAGAGWDNGAISTNRLYDLEDGWLSFVADTTAGAYVIGFATDTTNFSDAGITQGIYITADNFVYVTEAGVNTLMGAKIPGDVFRVARAGNQVRFYRNSAVLKTATVDPSLILRIKSAVHSGSSPQVLTSIERPGSAADGYKVRWVDISGATDSNSILTKQGSPGRGNGAHSANVLGADKDGWLEYEIFQSTSRYTIGFSTYAGPYRRHTANYGFSVGRGDTLSVYENGSDSIAIATWQVGDKLRIARTGDDLIYYRNTQEVWRVSIDPATELRVRTVIGEGMSPAVFASFGTRVVVLAKTITPVKVNGTGGGIAVQPLHGREPYTYHWSGGGEATGTISNKNAGIYSVTVEDARGVEQVVPYTLGFKASWTDLTLVSNNNGTLKKMATSVNAWNGGANSFNLLEAGQDGWIEVAIDTGESNYIIGFSGNSAGFEQERIDYGLSIIDGQMVAAYEKSALGIPLSSWQPGDVLKIWRIDNTVKYYRNGVELRSVAADPDTHYRLKATVRSGEVPPVSVSFDVPLILQSNFTPVKSYGLAGGIAVVPVTGTPPFTYSWSTNENTQAIAGKAIGTYSVVVADSEGRAISNTYDLGYKVLWTDVTNATEGANGVLGKSTTDGSIGGGNSVNVLKANEDGWLQFTVDNSISNVSLGFATYNGVFNTAAIDHALTVKPGAPVMATANNWTGTSLGDWKLGDVFKIARVDDHVTYYRNGVAIHSVDTDPSKEMIIKAAIYNGRVSMVLTSIPVNDRVATPIDETTVTYKIPKAVKITRDGRMPVAAAGPCDLFLSQVTAGEPKPVFPGCPTGNYYVGFQLLYDLGNRNTTEDWSAYVQLTMFHNEDSLWTRPLRLKMADQTFIATAFYDETISCDGSYFYRVDFKTLDGDVPQDNIYLKTLLYSSDTIAFDPNENITFYCPPPGHEKELHWNHSNNGTVEYDVEWVFIEAHENFSETAQKDLPFTFKEPVRITTPYSRYLHQPYYPDGKIWYRVRAVGYSSDSDFPDHRIPGKWFYPSCGPSPIDNHQPDMNWQQQTVFAEEGKNKKVMNYFDGSMRQRQAQTNLSTEKVTLVGEALYDFEGRSAVNVLSVPATDNSLVYKSAFNVFISNASIDPVVKANTSEHRNKFHYDNYKLENTAMSDTSGAGQYYSKKNASASVHRNYIPDSKGYVYSQTEYLNDGTGRVSRQSGVGEEFRMDADTAHTTRYGYAEAAPEELIRLFGNNVGKAEHYKKNAVIDPNGQVSISYLDQEDRVIATALAGESPANVEPLQSYKDLDPTPITISLGAKNKKGDGMNTISHKIMNVKQNTSHTFNYDLSAYVSEIAGYGCTSCSYELKIALTDPDGKPIDLSGFAGSDPVNTTKSYVRRNITATCTDPAIINNVQFTVLFEDIGDYTITKTLASYDRSFEQMDELLRQNETIIEKMNEVKNSIVVDAGNCEICTQACPEADSVINEAIDEIAEQDCDNIHRLMEQDYQEIYEQRYALAHHDSISEEVFIIPEDTLRLKHPLYCKYELCMKDKASAVFEKQIVRAANWDAAVSMGYSNLLAVDPFFNDPDLSGYGDPKNDMQALLENLYLANLNDHTYSGTISEVTDPANTDYYVDEEGYHNTGGRHLLYLDLMGKRAQGMISESVYQQEISHSRWALYRGFYLEAKRKLKLTLDAYKNCAPAMEELQQMDDAPDTEEEMLAWGEENYAIIGDEATPDQIETSITSLKMNCMTEFTAEDTTALKAHLRLYFKSSQKNFFRLILKRDRQANNPHLGAIQLILNKYNCNIDSLVLDDPMECAKDTVIVIPGFTPSQPQPVMLRMQVSEDTNQSEKLAASSPFLDELLAQQHAAIVREDSLMNAVKRRFEEELEAISTAHQDPVDALNNLAARSSSSFTTLAGPLPDPGEYAALKAIYNATGGSNWHGRNGWETVNNFPIQSVQNWTGVTIDANGHIKQLYLRANNLVGSLPDEIDGLIYADVIIIDDNPLLSGPIPASLGNLNDLRVLWMSYNDLTGEIPDELGGMEDLEQLSLDSNDLSGAIPTSIGNLTKLRLLSLSSNINLSGTIPDFSNLTSLEALGLNGNKLSGYLSPGLINPNLLVVGIGQNRFTFKDFIDFKLALPETVFFSYPAQELVDTEKTITVEEGQPLTLITNIDRSVNPQCKYQWVRLPGTTFPAESSTNGHTVFIPSASTADAGKYFYTIRHDNAPDLVLMSAYQTVVVVPSCDDLTVQYNALMALYQATDGDNWTNNSGWAGADPNTPQSLAGWHGVTTDANGRVTRLQLSNNNLNGTIPAALGNLCQLRWLLLSNNKLQGGIPAALANLTKLNFLYVDRNELTDPLPANLVPAQNRTFQVKVEHNKLTFSDLLYTVINGDWGANCGEENDPCFTYAPQALVDVAASYALTKGQSLTLTANIDRLTTPGSTFQWFRSIDGTYNNRVAMNEASPSGHTVTIQDASAADGGKYFYEITNPDGASELTLRSHFRTVSVNNEFTFCTEYNQNTASDLFGFKVSWDSVIQNCMRNARLEQEILTQHAIDKLIEEEMSTFYNQFKTNCFERVNENLKYSYRNIEHHYTLYYYDQAGNLVQTVPPEGVRPLNKGQVDAIMGGGAAPETHKLATRYKYSSLKQLVSQQTPDAGESQFWYNEKSQIRLSQNAQQRKDNNYSYTKYDEQGRIVEVGEMNTPADVTTLRDSLESLNFPDRSNYTLADITRTRYDLAKPDLATDAGFAQTFLRSRVASVEVIAKDQADTVATYYSYDIHGKVKSLLQQLPGLGFKRTDYVYDLISGKVNYVMYQYGMSEEFIHRYTYDADNRIEEVFTSSDGFIWDRDASYDYYHHGPLARQVMGEYHLQGLDHYYTLQGWIKGVNGIGYDPGNDGTMPQPADVFGYNLGFYKNDYTAVGLSADSNVFHQPIQAYTGLMGNEGLYNGNIAWMATSLKKIGQVRGNHLLSTQAMLYQYDQLHRITRSRSLTPDPVTGEFNSRNASPQAYDEDYSYDANGNLLTLHRLDDKAELKDNFIYGYYRNTNKLKQLIPVVRDTTYDGGAITSNQKVYRKIVINGNAYVPAGTDVVLKATDSIVVHNDFDVADDANFQAYVLPDEEGVFLYDAIGNLVWDQEEGVKISWNPYGKVREIVKGDTTTIRFRYDGAGNRIEKQVIRADRTTITRYVRDARGNVMALYKDTAMIEQSIYGSNRLGLYHGGRRAGHRTLGSRNYEFSNHLGNVLIVISDNIYLNSDSAWTKIISASDYYPFGLTMEGRIYYDTAYRYGFNGKEKDDSGEWGGTHYDYGFRIYNPRIAKFLSVDPLTKSYPWYTPYQFAGNKPIMAIDMDGLEEAIIIGSKFYENRIKIALDAGNYEEAMRLAYKATSDPAKNKFAEKMYRGKFAASKGYNGKFPSGISLVSSTGEVLHTQRIPPEIKDGSPDRQNFEFEFRVGIGGGHSQKVNVFGIGEGYEAYVSKTLYSYRVGDDYNDLRGVQTEGVNSGYRIDVGAHAGPFGGGYTVETDSKGVFQNEVDFDAQVLNRNIDYVNKKTTDGYKFLDIAGAAGPFVFNIELKVDFQIFKQYKDPTKVEQDATRYVTPGFVNPKRKE